MMDMMQDLIADDMDSIIKRKPFNQIIEIDKLSSLYGLGAVSGESYKVTASDGKGYKLRKCKKEEHARYMEKNMMLLPDFFPRFYGRDDEYLLSDWIEGDYISDGSEPIFFEQMGFMVGQAHSLNNKNGEDIDRLFNKKIKTASTVLSGSETEMAKEMYSSLKAKLNLEVVLEFHDLHPKNIIINDKRMYYVDEEGLGHKIKGLGFAEPFFGEVWITSQKSKDAFWRGYNKINSSNFFTKDYQDMVALLQSIRTLSAKANANIDCAPYKIMLYGLLREHYGKN